MAKLTMTQEGSSPSTPGSDKWIIYPKAGGWYSKDDNGNEYEITPSSFQPGGRLTLTTAVPVTTSDVTGATNVFYTPYVSDKIALWNGAFWQPTIFTEKTLALGTVTSGLPYDVFGYLASGTLALEKLAWTNGTTRATGISIQDGRYCKTGDKTRLYLGTFYTTSTTQTEDSNAKRFLYNFYNRRLRKMIVREATASWTYSTSTYRSLNNNTANRIQIVNGVAEDLIDIDVMVVALSTAINPRYAGIGVNSTSTNTWDILIRSAGIEYSLAHTKLKHYPAVGFTFYQALEYGSGTGTQTWHGADEAGIGADWMC